MSRVTAAALLMALLSPLAVACAADETTGPELATRGLCYWDDVKWDDRGILRFRGGSSIGRARARWNGSAWGGANVSGVLRPRGGQMSFEGRWTGGGLAVSGLVDVGNDAVFSVWDPTRISGGMLMRGAHVTVLDARVGSALVLPSEAALNAFVPAASPAVELSCESLAIRPRQSATEEWTLLAKAGFAPTSEVSFTGDEVVAAWERPGRDFLGAFVPNAARAWQLASEGEWARVASVRDGVVWVGWVARARLDVPKERPPTGGVPGSLAGAEKLTWRSCDEAMSLLVKGPHGANAVATLASRTPFALLKHDFDHDPDYDPVVVAPQWLELSRGVQLLAPTNAARCGTVVGPW